MRKLLLALCAMTTVVACNKDDNNEQEIIPERTVLIYMAANNNLSQWGNQRSYFAQEDLIQIKQGVNTSIEQAMQGRIAGVQVTQNSGSPGGGISVQIRGINSLNGNEPLYVVDGIAMSGQSSSNTSVLLP